MYEIIRKLSETTFIASDENGIVVLKKVDYEDTAVIRTLSEIKNPHICACFGMTIIEDEIFAVFEYVSGETLEKYVESRGALNDEEVRKIVSDICDGLSEIHAHGIVHRDITPSNVMISSDGETIIIDFGISRTVKEKASNDTQILGTHGYAAPEQFGFRQSTAKADIYAVGVLINYMKTLCLPGEKLASGFFLPIIEKCTEMDEANRYENAAELSEAVKAPVKKKMTLKSLIYVIPGFKEGHFFLNIVSLCYYFFAFGMFWAVDKHGEEAFFKEYLPVFLTFWMPYFLMWDIGSWTDKLGISREKNKIASFCVRIAASVISLAVAMLLV